MPVASASDSKNGGAVASHRNTPGVTVKSVEYIISSVNVEGCPPAEEDRAEFALVGRSNVGKSSLINMLTNRRDLAHTSKTPGKTRTINHFLVNKSWYLVDLPGYGYAKVSKSDRETFLSFVKEYFLKRETLANVFVLVDSSIEPQTIDLDCIDWLGEHQIPFTIVFTKADKRKKLKKGRASGRKANASGVKSFMLALEKDRGWDGKHLPPRVITSSADGTGRREVMQRIRHVLDLYEGTKELEVEEKVADGAGSVRATGFEGMPSHTDLGGDMFADKHGPGRTHLPTSDASRPTGEGVRGDDNGDDSETPAKKEDDMFW